MFGAYFSSYGSLVGETFEEEDFRRAIFEFVGNKVLGLDGFSLAVF